MRIKKIVNTERYRHVNFGELEGSHENSEVFTPNGWSKVKAFEYIKRGPSKIIDIETGFQLVCDPGHTLQAYNSDGVLCAITAAQLDNTYKLVGYDNKPIAFAVADGGDEDFWDIEIDDPHWWYTSSVVSHNSVVLCNNAISSIAGNSGDSVGQDVLLITYELDAIKTALRCLGVVARDIPIDQLQDHQEYINRVVRQMQETYNKRFLIVEWPPDECSVANIYALLDSLRRTDNWKPDVVVVDYLDLMVSRNPEYNKDDYTRQKHVANELRGLAINEDVLIFTATQTNRTAAGGGEEELADLSKASESFAKQFSLDYVVSLNQSRSERSAVPPRMRMFVTKNRNGPKNVIVQCSVTYETMLVREL